MSITPTKSEIAAAAGRPIADVLDYGLKVVFCGINPGLYSAAVGHNFGRPGNRFWRALHLSGFTDRLLSPFEEGDLLSRGYGITNIVNKATARADQLTQEDLLVGAEALRAKIIHYHPRILAVLGISAYRVAFNRKHATWGAQPESIGDTIVWVLPNPSGLNANFQLSDIAKAFEELKNAVTLRV
jgi:double-stranded uracil-DNA glycosylase